MCKHGKGGWLSHWKSIGKRADCWRNHYIWPHASPYCIPLQYNTRIYESPSITRGDEVLFNEVLCIMLTHLNLLFSVFCGFVVCNHIYKICCKITICMDGCVCIRYCKMWNRCVLYKTYDVRYGMDVYCIKDVWCNCRCKMYCKCEMDVHCIRCMNIDVMI